MAQCRASSLRVLAITQMVIGALVIIFGILCIITVRHWTSYVGFGIWTGIWVVITGILGFLGAKHDNSPNKCLIGCFMGFSITACVISGIMFICYGFAVSYFSEKLRMYNMYGNEFYYYSPYRAKVGAGFSSCQLILSIVEFFISLASSISCCSAICCGTSAVSSGSANQQVLYMHTGTQQIYSGGQSGVVIIQPTGAVGTAWPPDFTNAGQQTVFIPQQPPGYWAVPQTISLSHAGTTMPTQSQVQQPLKEQEMPPPYNFRETGNVSSLAAADGAQGAHAGTVQV